MNDDLTDNYTIFANHPMAATYFKYVKILKSKATI
jgi:hypothetical protein